MSFNIVDLVKDQVKGQLIGHMGNLLGNEGGKATDAVGGMIPALLSGITGSASTNDGANSLFGAIQDQDDSLLDNMGSLLGGGQASTVVDNGNSVLGNLLGSGGLSKLAGALSGFSGLSKGGTSSIMGMLAPIILGVLKRKVMGDGLNAGGLSSMLTSQSNNIGAAMPQGLSDQLNASGFLSSIGGGLGGGISEMGAAGAGAAAGAVGAATAGAASLAGNAGAAVGNVAGSARDGVANVAGTVGDVAGSARDGVANAAGAVGDVAGNARDGVANAAGNVAGSARDGVANAAGAVGDVAGSARDGVANAAGAVGDVAGNARDGVSNAAGAVGDVAGNARDGVANAAGSVSSGVSNATGAVGNTVEHTAEKGGSMFRWLLPVIALGALAWAAFTFLLPGSKDAATDAAGQVGDAASGAAATATDAATDAVDATKDAAASATETATDAAASATDAVTDTAASATETATDAAASATETATDAAASATDAATDMAAGAVDPEEIKGQLGGIFSGAAETLGGISDLDSAQAALPKLTELGTSVDSVSGLMDKIPEAARGPFSSIASGGMEQLQPMVDKVMDLPGVGDVVGPILKPILEKLTAFGG